MCQLPLNSTVENTSNLFAEWSNNPTITYIETPGVYVIKLFSFIAKDEAK
jgi:hypothetical protein